MKYIYTFIFIIFNFVLYSNPNIFYEINWNFEKEKKGISLSIAKDKEIDINYYRASTIVKNIKFDKIVYILSDFDNYSKVFPRTLLFKPVKILEDNRYIVHSILNFFPYKNREYLVEVRINFEKVNEKRIFNLIWYPEKMIKNFNFNKKNHSIKNVYGMWQIEELDNNEVKITFFSFNDWEISAPKSIKVEFEKDGTINNVLDLLDYIYSQK